jgi:hypothetical protein
LSVSTETITSKEQGGPQTSFYVKKYRSDELETLKQLFTTRNTSPNLWDGTRKEEHYVGSHGAGLDFDGGATIEQVRYQLAQYNYVLHTTTSHLIEKNGVVAPRFRVFLPYAPGAPKFTSPEDCKRVYVKLASTIPGIDTVATGPAQQFFPFAGKDPSKFEFYVNETGEYFDVDISGVPIKSSTRGHTYFSPEELNTSEELDRMLKFDQFIPWCIANASLGLAEPLWHAMISNLCRFESGKELIHEISAKDPEMGRYDFDETDDKIQHALESSGPIGYEEIVRRGWPGVAPAAPLAPAGWAKIGRIQNRKPLFPDSKNPDIYLEHDDSIIVDSNGARSAVLFGSLKQQVKDEGCVISAVCPFCDHDSAKIRANTFHFAYLHCDHCNRSYWEHPDSPELFTYNGDLLRVEMKGNKFISHEKLKSFNFRSGDEWAYACHKVMNDPKRRFIGDSFTINRIGNADFDALGYELNANDNSVAFKFPAIGVEVQDNSLIDKFLDRMFGERSTFVKDWMALYAFTNYVSLPVIVLTGPRSCGKNTLAELVGEIFPTLKATWDGDKEQFNDFAKAKLVFVDENRNSEKPVQYAEIKRLTGNRTLKVNEKHVRQYYVRNNAKFIFATNDPRPIALHWREEPESEKTNNFFIYPCPAVPAEDVDRELFDKLKARLGHYVRTELKRRYEAWRRSGGMNSRYALDTPITDLAKQLFGSSKNLIELEAEELAQYLVCGINRVDLSAKYPTTIYFEPIQSNGSLYVPQAELRDLVQRLNFKGHSNYKSYITVLQDQGVLSHKNDHRVSNQRLGYQILRKPDYYTTVSGVMAAEETVVSLPSRLSILETTSTANGRVFF